jgi:archaellum biogenesis protein FlaJ (TadC family)
LGIRDQLRSSLQEDAKQRKGGSSHSKAYHRHFEGYSEIIVPKRGGKGTSIQRIYTGDYFRQDLTNRQRILIRVLYVALFLCIAFLYTSSAILPLKINSTWYVVLPQAVTVPFLFWILIAFFSYLPAEPDMKIADYRSSSQYLLKAAMGSAICLGITALATLVFIMLNPSDESSRAMLCAGKYLLAGLLALVMYRIERMVSYLTIPNQHLPPDNSFEIN